MVRTTVRTRCEAGANFAAFHKSFRAKDLRMVRTRVSQNTEKSKFAKRPKPFRGKHLKDCTSYREIRKLGSPTKTVDAHGRAGQ